MTTIVVAHPTARYPEFTIFGTYDGPDDRFVFGGRKFAPADQDWAEA